MKNFLIIIFIFTYFSATSQIDSIENEIMNYQNSSFEIISKARRLLIDKLNQGDYQKMKEIKDYLIKKTDNKAYVALSDQEYLLILYWTQEFNELLGFIEQGISKPEMQQPVNHDYSYDQFNDGLYENLLQKSKESMYLLEIVINNSELSNEEKNFLKLHLNYCLFNSENPSITQDSLNIMAEDFISKYPVSPYRPFIRKEIYYKVQMADYGVAYDFFIGYGNLSDGMSKSFSDYAPFGFAIDLIYKNFDLDFGIGLGVSRLKQNIVYQNITWDKDLMADIYFPSVSLGYTFFPKSKLNINPFVGIYGIFIAPEYEDIQNNTSLENISLQSDASSMAGLCINYNLRAINTTNRFTRSYHLQGYMKFKYTYFSSAFNKDYYGLDGNMQTFCITFGALLKRIYRI